MKEIILNKIKFQNLGEPIKIKNVKEIYQLIPDIISK